MRRTGPCKDNLSHADVDAFGARWDLVDHVRGAQVVVHHRVARSQQTQRAHREVIEPAGAGAYEMDDAAVAFDIVFRCCFCRVGGASSP